jgi:hypothetical protein
MRTVGTSRLLVGLASVAPVAVLMFTSRASVAGQTAWESYKNRIYPESADKHLTDPALLGAIDLHAHCDPDSYPRSWDGFEVARLAKERGMRGVLLKNHWTETAGRRIWSASTPHLVTKSSEASRWIRRWEA